nr:hypothetical protein [Tanacetum cinerariifolium]
MRSPTLPSIPILSQGGYFRELTRSCQTEKKIQRKLVSPPEGTEPVIPPPSTDTTTTGARITVRLQAAISLPPEAETETPPHKRLCLSTPGSRYEIGENSTARPTGGQGIDHGFVSTLDAEARRQGIGGVGYGIRDTWVDPAEAVPEIAHMTVGEVNTRVTELAE